MSITKKLKIWQLAIIQGKLKIKIAKRSLAKQCLEHRHNKYACFTEKVFINWLTIIYVYNSRMKALSTNYPQSYPHYPQAC